MIQVENKSISAQAKARLSLIVSMVIFGTIGVFRRYLPLPSGLIAMFRGITGGIFLLAYVFIRGKRPSARDIKANLIKLIVSGTFIGFNWILLFEAYNYTSVAVATLCYHMAPVIVTLASPLLLGERLTGKKAACIFAAVAGMALVSGIFTGGTQGIGDMRGVFLGLGAAVLYALVIIMNKKLQGISAYDRTIVQLIAAGLVLTPYVAARGETAPGMFMSASSGMLIVVAMLLIVGIVHTGFAYVMYFGSLADIDAQTAALMSYIDPIVAIILSAVLLQEGMSGAEIAGAVLVMGAMVISEIPIGKIRRR